MTTIQAPTEEHPREPRGPWTTIGETEVQRARVSWGALFAGAAVALVTSAVLNMLGYGIGAVALDPGPGQGGQAQAIGIGAGIWTLVVSLIALFVGGWIAGRLSGRFRRFEGVLHGLVTWSLVTLAVLWIVTTAVGSIVGGAFSVVSETAPAVAGQMPQDLGQVQQQAGQVGPQQAQQVAGRAADITGGSAIVLAVAMILGAIAAAAGGLLGAGRQRKEMVSAGASVH